MAILLLEHKAGLGEFSDQVAQRSDVSEMIEKINFHVDSAAESAGFDKMTSILKITLKNGKFISGQAAFGKGSPSDPMSFEEACRQIQRLRRVRGMAASENRKNNRVGEDAGSLLRMWRRYRRCSRQSTG